MKATMTQKANRPLALGIFAMTLTVAAIGGTDIAMAQTTAPITRQPNQADHSLWNDGVVDTLGRKSYLAVQAWTDGNSTLAIRLYKDGLREILSSADQTDYRLSWTYKIAERTLALTERLQSLTSPDAERDIPATLLVLQSTYSMIEQYYYSLDIQFWTPYYLMCNGRGHAADLRYDVLQFESVLRNYSLYQIAWFQKQFVRSVNDEVTPQFSSKVFLTVLSSIARGLARDLATDPNSPNPSLFPFAYGQASRSLNTLADDIDNYQTGNGIFTDDRRAVNYTYNRLSLIIGYINSSHK